MKKTVFTEQAEINLNRLISDIESRFDRKVAHQVLLKVKDVIRNLSIYPELGKRYRDEIRFVVVSSKTILLYSVKNDSVIILDFFDSRQNWMELL